jgi:hypothetical protein
MMGVVDDMLSLPEDSAALRALLLVALEQRNAVMAERDVLADRNEQLHHLLLQLKRRQCGCRKNSCCSRSGDKHAKPRRGNRGQLPAQLPRIEQVLLPERETCPCFDRRLVEIGSSSAERLDMLPAQSQVLVTR